jgi:hypothetical protein
MGGRVTFWVIFIQSHLVALILTFYKNTIDISGRSAQSEKVERFAH